MKKEEYLRNCHGKRFTAVMTGTLVEGIISVEGDRIYLCQNEMSGSPCSERFGYRNSWIITVDGEVRLDYHSIRVTSLRVEEEDEKDFQGMSHDQVKVGMEVIPHRRSFPGKYMRISMYVVNVGKDFVSLSEKTGAKHGLRFKASDLELIDRFGLGIRVRLREGLRVGAPYGNATFVDAMNFEGYREIYHVNTNETFFLEGDSSGYYYTREMVTA